MTQGCKIHCHVVIFKKLAPVTIYKEIPLRPDPMPYDIHVPGYCDLRECQLILLANVNTVSEQLV